MRICGALPSVPFMCPLNLSCNWFENRWRWTFTHLRVCIILLPDWVENSWSSTFTPLHVYFEIFAWLGWELVELYLHSPTCAHWSYREGWLRLFWALPSRPYTCSLNFWSRGSVENRRSSTFTPLLVSIEMFITWLVWQYVELYLHSPTCVYWNIYHVAGLRIVGALPPLPYMCSLKFLSRGWVDNRWNATFIPNMWLLKFLTRRCVENKWSFTFTPLHVYIEIFITWLC